MEEIIAKLTAVAQKRYENVPEIKKRTGQKVIGVSPMYVPEELIHAAGLLPVVLQGNVESFEHADRYFQTFYCGLARGIADEALRGKLDFLDGVVVPDLCIPLRCLAGVLQLNFKVGELFLQKLHLPANLLMSTAKPWMLEELERFRVSLEEYTGREINDRAIRESICIYNRNRTLLRKLYDFRRENPSQLSAAQMLNIVTAGMLMPKAEHSALLEQLVQGLRPAKSANGRINVILSGSLCESPRADLLNVIEELGGQVVDDDLYLGYRYFARDVREEGDPLEALADSYLGMTPPCATRLDIRSDWGIYVENMARRGKAKGAILWLVKYCEPHEVYIPHIIRHLNDRAVPNLLLEQEDDAVSVQQVRTRVQGFMEMLKGG